MFKFFQLITLAALISVTSPAFSQVFPRGNGVSLAGLDRVDVFVRIANWGGLEQDQQEFRLDAQQRLVRAIEDQTGVSARPSRTDQLICNVHAQRDGNQVIYATRLEYWALKSTDVHVLQWEQEAVSSARANRFNAREVASTCAEFFTAEWQRWNNAD